MRSSREVRVVREDGAVVCARCVVADRALARMRGLLGRTSLDPDEGILLRPAGSIHMAFMRFAIDAVFLDRDLKVVRVVEDLAPWRAASKRGAKSVLEVPAGTCARVGLREGERVRLEDAAAVDA